MPPGAGQLRSLMEQLAKAPRRRDFKTVPMILDTPDLWDAQALDAIIAYRGSMKQLWDNTEIGSPWLNLMRNSLNAQVFSFRHPDFLEVSATHGSAQLALYDQAILAGDTIPALQQRGVVFMACHNAIWEHTAKLVEKGINRDKQSHQAIAAELTNHLIEGVVLTPGMAGTIPELQQAGFHYAK
jgi:hypothetical protein